MQNPEDESWLREIRAGDELYLSPEFAFRGRVHLEAGRKDLEFEGGAQMQFECDDFDNE